MAWFEATYSQIIIQNTVVSKGQPSFFSGDENTLGLVCKVEFSTPWQRAQVRLDHVPHGQGCSIQATQQFSSRSWGQVNGDSLLTTACHQQLISWACKVAATDLHTLFSPERLTLEKQGSNCSLKVTWKLDLWPKFISNPSKNCSFAIIFQRMPLITHQEMPCAFKNHSRISKIK